MTLRVCLGCRCRFSVGAPACPQCGGIEHVEEGQEMPKITVHGGATNAADLPVLLEQGEHVVRREAVAHVSVDGVDQGPGVADETLGGDFAPLPEAVEGGTAEHVSVPDYGKWTVAQLREALANRQPPLPTDGLKADLVARLQEADQP